MSVGYILTKFAIALISPLGAALVLGVLAWLLGVAGKRRLALWLAGFALVWLWGWSLPVASMAVRARVEAAYPHVPFEILPNVGAIVVLGGGVSPPQRLGAPPNLEKGADRVWHAARLYHAGKAPLIFASGGSDPIHSPVSEAAAMRVVLRELGVPEHAIVLEDRSRTTRENARYTAQQLHARGINSVLLVTSALHMARAVRLFEAEGVGVLAAPTDHEARRLPAWQGWLPDSEALDGSARALKELAGQLAGF